MECIKINTDTYTTLWHHQTPQHITTQPPIAPPPHHTNTHHLATTHTTSPSHTNTHHLPITTHHLPSHTTTPSHHTHMWTPQEQKNGAKDTREEEDFDEPPPPPSDPPPPTFKTAGPETKTPPAVCMQGCCLYLIYSVCDNNGFIS